MNQNKQIAIVMPSFKGGGAERMMVYLANNFYKRGYKVDYIVVNSNGPYKTLLNDGVNLVNLNKSRMLYSIFSLSSYIFKNRPNVLLSALSYVNIIVYIANILSLRKVKLVVSERTVPSPRIPNYKFKRFYKYMLRFVYSRVDKVIAISFAVKKDLVENIHINHNKIEVIYNMVDIVNIEEIDFEKKKILYNQTFNNDNYLSSKIIIGVGRLESYKNFSYLINAFNILSKEHDEFKLIILGEGKERQKLEQLIKKYGLEDKVKLLGFVNNHMDYMQMSSLFVSPSKIEGFGNVIIEAMAVGLPIIVTDCIGGPKEIVEYGKYGDIVPLNRADLLAEQMHKTLTKKNQPNVKKRAAEFSIDLISKQYLQVLLNN